MSPIATRSAPQSTSRLPTSPTSSSSERSATLDAWRTLSFLLIFTGHVTGATAGLIASHDPHLSWILRKTGLYTGLGLQYFFVFSGCLITRLLLEAKGTAHYYRNYYMRRALRIFPLYYAFLLVCIVILPAIFGRKAVLYDFFELRLAPTCLWLYGTNIWQTLKHGWCFGYLIHLWSMSVEEHYYLVWPLVVAILTPRRLLQFSWLLIAVSTVVRMVAAFGMHDLIATRVNTLCNMDCIAAGAIVAVLIKTKPQEELRRIAKWLIVCGLLVLAYYVFMSLKHIVFCNAFLSTTGAVISAGVILKTLIEPNSCRLPGHNLLKHVGKYCYGLYLIHYPIVHFVCLHFVKDSWPAPILFGAIFIIAWIPTVLLAWLSFKYLETPFLNLKDRFDPPHKSAVEIRRGSGRDAIVPPV